MSDPVEIKMLPMKLELTDEMKDFKRQLDHPRHRDARPGKAGHRHCPGCGRPIEVGGGG